MQNKVDRQQKRRATPHASRAASLCRRDPQSSVTADVSTYPYLTALVLLMEWFCAHNGLAAGQPRKHSPRHVLSTQTRF